MRGSDLDALIFDFDGVLADSVEVKTRAFAKLFQSYGPEIEDRVVKYHRNNGGMSRYVVDIKGVLTLACSLRPHHRGKTVFLGFIDDGS